MAIVAMLHAAWSEIMILFQSLCFDFWRDQRVSQPHQQVNRQVLSWPLIKINEEQGSSQQIKEI